jgi:hypothetical protein
MRTLNRAVVGMMALALITVAIPTSTWAGGPSASDSEDGHRKPTTVVIDGREYGPKDGLQIDTWQFEIEPGSGSVGLVFDDMTSDAPGSITPMATWGASYAISTEWWSQLGYDGKAKAAANIWNGLRIIKVCMWYTRGGVVVAAQVCSTASSPWGTWLPGPEKTMSVWDSLDPFAPPTVFNFSITRINPGV